MKLSTLGEGLQQYGQPVDRTLSASAKKMFLLWTAFWWGGVGVLAVLFYIGQMDFVMSARVSLYGISIWLNGWIIAWFMQKNSGQSKLDLYHDCLVLWMLCYAITNVMWEIPWVIFSPHVFVDITTLDQVVAHTDYMRESVLNMWWWVLASFGAIDLRTVNGDGAFYAVEVYAFVNLAMTIYFFHLNNKRSPYRYLIPVLGAGEPVAATFIFSFAEVFSDFENMPGGIGDTLLALVWTQYQYFIFPLIFGFLGLKLFLNDWRRMYVK